MYVRNCWYVAAWSHELDADGMLARTVLGEPLLLLRTGAGEVVALEDRCCHRAAPLSAGRREGDAVRCGYHGLKFDARGACVEIPGQATIPPQARVRTYPIAEHHRWVYVWMGDPALADPALLPDNRANADPGLRYRPDYLHYDCNYLWIADNLLDFSHLSYVHASTLGGTDRIAQSKPTIERLDRGLRITRRVRDVPPAPYQRAFANFPGNVDRWFVYDFVLPGILLMHSGSKPPGREWDDFDGALQLYSCQALTPETDDTTHYFFMQGHAFALDDPSVTEAIHRGVTAAFDEDRRMILSQVARLRPDERFLPIHADAALNQFRRLVQRLAKAERGTGPADAPAGDASAPTVAPTNPGRAARSGAAAAASAEFTAREIAR